jgi:hypothetical protein
MRPLAASSDEEPAELRALRRLREAFSCTTAKVLFSADAKSKKRGTTAIGFHQRDD